MTSTEAVAIAREAAHFRIPDKVSVESVVATIHRNRMTMANIRLTEWTITKRFSRACPPDSMARDDLTSDLCFGLVKTCGRFDHDRGLKFSTFAAHTLHGYGMSSLTKSRRRGLTGAEAGLPAVCDVEPLNLGREEDDDAEAKQEFVRSLIEKVEKPRHREVLTLYFVDGLTLEAVGNGLGITRERVRQIVRSNVDRWKRCVTMGTLTHPLERR